MDLYMLFDAPLSLLGLVLPRLGAHSVAVAPARPLAAPKARPKPNARFLAERPLSHLKALPDLRFRWASRRPLPNQLRGGCEATG
jgi:hypothetical protein